MAAQHDEREEVLHQESDYFLLLFIFNLTVFFSSLNRPSRSKLLRMLDAVLTALSCSENERRHLDSALNRKRKAKWAVKDTREKERGIERNDSKEDERKNRLFGKQKQSRV